MKAFLAALCALALAGCATLTPGSAVNPSPATQVTLAKGEYAFEVTYNVAAQAYLVAAPSLDPATKAQAKGLLLQMLSCTGSPGAYTCTGLVQVARDAEKVADASTLAQQITKIENLAAQVQTLLHAAPATGTSP